MMKSMISRRTLLSNGLALSVAAPILNMWSGAANAAALTALDPADPTAKALGFVTDATKVDTATNPTFKAAQKCASCAQYQGKASDPVAACNIFGGKSVPNAGWCKVWVLKPGAAGL